MPVLKPVRLTTAITLSLGLLILASFNGPEVLYQMPPQQVEWQLDTTLEGVQFFHASIACNGKQAVIIKFNNQNNYPVQVSWKEILTDEGNQRHESAAGIKKLVINPGETAASGCNENRNRQLLVLPDQSVVTHAIRITQFQFRDLIVSKA